MKKTIAAVALMASATTSMAMPFPHNEPPKTMCLKVYSAPDKSKEASDCDDSDNNATLKLKLKANGCAAGQVVISTYDQLNIPKCMPAGAIQL
jgi:hypothetical protein